MNAADRGLWDLPPITAQECRTLCDYVRTTATDPAHRDDAARVVRILQSHALALHECEQAALERPWPRRIHSILTGRRL
jgi:hypothetical protein